MPSYVIGIDEVGRGALAGPVVVAAAMIPKGVVIIDKQLGRLKDSKKLSAKQRELWYGHFKIHPKIVFAVARVYPRGIERMNISKAANVAAERACERLMRNMPSIGGSGIKIFLDGGLFIGNGDQPKNAKTVVKGDEKIKIVAVASIVAKVQRDGFMGRLAKRHPEYAFDLNKGYGTEKHRKALKKFGATAVHRRTFLGNML